jgi:hypothetical protein
MSLTRRHRPHVISRAFRGKAKLSAGLRPVPMVSFEHAKASSIVPLYVVSARFEQTYAKGRTGLRKMTYE